MEVKNFEDLIKDAREEFRWALKGYSNVGHKQVNTLGKLIKKYLDKCCSTFEEETLKENLQEEFANYLEGLKQTEGE